MKQLPFKVLIETSGVRGRNVYELTTRRQKLGISRTKRTRWDDGAILACKNATGPYQ